MENLFVVHQKAWYTYTLIKLDFVIDRFFMKLFKANDIRIIRSCQEHFCFKLPSIAYFSHGPRNQKTASEFCW